MTFNQPKLRVRCQECNNICRCRMLHFDIICPSCGKYAKRVNQKLTATTEMYRGKEREVFIVA